MLPQGSAPVASDPLDDVWSKSQQPQQSQSADPLDAAFDAEAQRKHMAARRDVGEGFLARPGTVTVGQDAGRGIATGLADAGYGFAQGLTWLANKAAGGRLDSAEASLARQREEMHSDYDAEGTAGTVGTGVGRVLGEGAMLMGEAGVAAKGLKALSGVEKLGGGARVAGKLSRAIEMGHKGNLAQRVAANTLPALPLDFVTGAGSAAPGESRLHAGLKNVAIGVALPVAIEGSVSVVKGGIRAVQSALDVSGGMIESGVSGVGETLAHDTDDLKAAFDTEQARRVDAIERDPLNSGTIGARRIMKETPADIEQRTAALGTSTGEVAPLSVADGTYFDATGKAVVPAVPDLHTVPEQVIDPLVTVPAPYRPKAAPPIITTETKQLEAMEGGSRFDTGKPAKLFENEPGPNPLPIFSRQAENVVDANRRLETASAYRTRKPDGAIPAPAPAIDQAPPMKRLGVGTGEESGASSAWPRLPEPETVPPANAKWTPTIPVASAGKVAEEAPTRLLFPSARDASGKLRANLKGVRSDALSDELAAIDAARAADTPGYHVTSPEHAVGVPWSGTTPGGAKAIGRNAQRSKSFIRISDELESRGISIEQALDDVAERRKLGNTDGPEVDKASGDLKDANGFTLFSHPVVGGAVLGGVYGGQKGDTDEDRARNMLFGAVAGAAAVVAGTRALPALAAATRVGRHALAETLAPALAVERRALVRNVDVLDKEANTDALTGFGNARSYAKVVKAAEQNPEARIIRADLNGFKSVNDKLGHEAGDDALRAVAVAMRKAAPDHPMFRVGGDEFVIIAHMNDAEAIRDAVEKGVGVQEKDGARYSISLGIGETDALADAAAMARKAEHKAAQGIAERADASALGITPEPTVAAPAAAPLPSVPTGAAPTIEDIGNTNTGSAHAFAPVVMGAAAGSTQGDTAEQRFKNAIAVAAVVVVGGVAARKAYNAVTGSVALSAMTAEAEAAIARIEGKIDFDGSIERGVKRAAAGSISSRVSRLADALANGAGAIERLGKMAGAAGLRPGLNPGELISYVKASDHVTGLFYDKGIVNAITREVSGPSFKSLFERFSGDDKAIRKAMSYVVAKRDVGRGLAGVGGDAQRLADAGHLAAWGDGDKVMSEFAKDWKTYTDGVGQYAVDSGMWTKELWDKVANSDALYVKYKRIIDSPARVNSSGVALTGAGQKLANITSGIQRFKGSTLAISNPIEAMAEYTSAIIRRADRYRVGASIFDAVDALGDEGNVLMTRVGNVPAAARPIRTAQTLAALQAKGMNADVLEAIDDTFAPVVDPKNPVLWRNSANGAREYGVVHSADLFNALSGLNTEKDASALRAVADLTLRPLRRIFTAATTGLSAKFALATNPIRDVIDAKLKSESGVGVWEMLSQGYKESFKDMFGMSTIAHDAGASGMGGTSMFGGNTNPAAVARRLAPTSKLDKLRSGARTAVSAPLELVEKLGEASDKGPRLAEYAKALREVQPQVDAGLMTVADARLQAAGRGRRVTIDFANKPGNKVLRELDDYIPFFGVALKAPVTMAGALVDNPKRAAAVGAGVALAAFSAWGLQHALPDEARAKLKDRPASERAGFILIPLDRSGETILRVPVGQEVGVLVQGITATLDAAVEHDPHAGRLMGQAVARAMPPGIGEALIDHSFTVPIPGIQQVIENIRNKRSFGGAPVESPRLEGLPAAERRYDTTSPTFDAMAAAGRAVGFSNLSPLQAENLARGVTSSVTPLITNITDPIAARIMGRDKQTAVSTPLSRSPLNPLSAVLASPTPSTTENEQDFYAIATRSKEGETLLHEAVSTGDMSAEPTIQKYQAVLQPEVLTIIKAVNNAGKIMRENEIAVRNAVGAHAMSPEAGRAQLDQLKAQKQDVYRRAMEILRPMNINP